MFTTIYKIKLCILIFSISLFINPFLAKAQNKDRYLTLEDINIYKKIFLALFIIAFPFIIYIIEYHLYFLLNFIYVLIFGKPYEKP